VTGDEGTAQAGGEQAGGTQPSSAQIAGRQPESARIDAWIWSVRLAKTRSAAAAACKAGHVRINDQHVKPAQPVRIGDRVRVRQEGWERIVVVSRVVSKRVGAVVAVECYVDHSPPPPSRDAAAVVGLRDRGAGRPTKRERRELDRLQGR
jgi:ribosome-associated heat shock protein Hsp15